MESKFELCGNDSLIDTKGKHECLEGINNAWGNNPNQNWCRFDNPSVPNDQNWPQNEPHLNKSHIDPKMMHEHNVGCEICAH